MTAEPVSDLSTGMTPVPRRVPDAYLRAEITAFPLASEESFRRCVIELDPRLSEDDGGNTRRLWRACENELAQHTGWSLDRLIAARDRGWFGDHTDLRRVSMPEYLRSLARGHLEPRAGVTRLAENPDISSLDAAIRYRWLTLVLPEDLLLGALDVDPPPQTVDLDPPMVRRRLLDLGVAEIHQHVGAAMDFPLLWTSVLAALATRDAEQDALQSPGVPFEAGQAMMGWLLACAITRCVLAEHLIRGRGSLHDFLDNEVLKRKNKDDWTYGRRETLSATLAALVHARDRNLPSVESLRDLYADLHPEALTLEHRPIECLSDAYRRLDPIAMRLGLCATNAGERWLVRQGLAYLQRSSQGHTSGTGATRGTSADDLFARLFWQTLRVRCQYYRAVVERPLTGGLQWFIRFYERVGKLRRPLDRILPEASFQHAADGQRISALELRKAPPDTAVDIGELLLGYLYSWKQVLCKVLGSQADPEVGVVLHFVKERDPKMEWLRGVPEAFWGGTHDEPAINATNPACGRFHAYFARQSVKAEALAELIRKLPSCLWFLRGLDVASDELGIPTWVLVPLFRHVLDTSAQVSLSQGAGRPLQVTAHVGEDFRHLMEGLRRIYEQIHYILGGCGGRLGHAIALGIDPEVWSESVSSVLMPAEERLWDLVWEWRLYSRYRIQPEYGAIAPGGRTDTLLNQIAMLSDCIYPGKDYRAEELAEAHHTLHRFLVPPHTPRAVVGDGCDIFRNGLAGLDLSQVRRPTRVAQILKSYLFDEAVFRRGQTLVDIPAHRSEVDALIAVQNALRCGIGQTGIVIEVNPSSNMLIGDLLDLRRHPILRLFPPVPQPDGPPPVPIALGSDDPVNFSTRLLREYTLLYQSALASGYPERTVNDWLESIRRTGMDARFTLKWLPNAYVKIEKLIQDFETYLQYPRSWQRPTRCNDAETNGWTVRPGKWGPGCPH